jgi:CLIP-associating protein 1/2
MESSNFIVMIASLQTLAKIIRSALMKACWTKFLELILLKIINLYKHGKEVSPAVIFQI